MKKRKQKEQPTKFQWDPALGDANELPVIHDLEIDARQGLIDEEQRWHLERRQSQTGKVMQSILGGKFGW